MKVMTVKLNPKTVFGLILVAAGVLVVLLTFLANHVKTGDAAPSAAEPAGLTCADVQAGARLLTDMGWQVGDSNQKDHYRASQLGRGLYRVQRPATAAGLRPDPL